MYTLEGMIPFSAQRFYVGSEVSAVFRLLRDEESLAEVVQLVRPKYGSGAAAMCSSVHFFFSRTSFGEVHIVFFVHTYTYIF